MPHIEIYSRNKPHKCSSIRSWPHPVTNLRCQLFTNTLDRNEHPYYRTIPEGRVSSHFYLRRDGHLIQFVSVLKRAWHAGLSSWQGRDRCNDFAVGIELEGSDNVPFTDVQYAVLHELTLALRADFSIAGIAGHSHIAPLRKTDPGPYFDWQRYLIQLNCKSFSTQSPGVLID